MTAAPQINQPTLGEMIEERRLQLGLTKSEAARLAGVSRGTWHEVETGKRANMLADTLNLFDKALGLERGTLRHASQPPSAKDPFPVPQTPVRTVAPSVGKGGLVDAAEAADLELRMQLIRLAMTMTGDEVRTLVHVADEFRRLVRAEISQRDETTTEGALGDRPTQRGDRRHIRDGTGDPQAAGAR